MTNFLRWRKMTWTIVVWTGAMALLLARGALASAPECATTFGPSSEFLTKQDCVSASGAGQGALEIVLISGGWFIGLVALIAFWFFTRPLWRQGHGLRFRRLLAGDVGWVPRDLSKLATPVRQP